MQNKSDDDEETQISHEEVQQYFENQIFKLKNDLETMLKSGSLLGIDIIDSYGPNLVPITKVTLAYNKMSFDKYSKSHK